MNYLMSLLSIFILISCSSPGPQRRSAWDDGAQKQQDYQMERQQEQQERLRNQFPGTRSF